MLYYVNAGPLMKTVLVISFGDLRTRKFCRYLPLHGFNSTILTETRSFRRTSRIVDNMDLKFTKVVCASDMLRLDLFGYLASRFGSNSRLFFLPDPEIAWIPNAYVKGLALCRTNDIDLIYVSSPPASAAILGYLLKKKTNLPLIIDFRDPWTLLQDPRKRYPSRLHNKIDQYIERRVLMESDHIITAARAVAQDYSVTYPEVGHKITTICNGFDSTDFRPPPAKFEKFSITYTGGLSSSGHRPYGLFLEALSNPINQGAIKKEDVQVFFIGSKTRRLVADIKRHDLQTVVTATERLPYEQALWYAASSSTVLLIELTNSLPLKVYEYLAIGVPILAIVREGRLAKLIRKYSPHSYVTTSDNVDDISDNIIAAYRKWHSGETPANPREMKEYFDRYERKNLTKELAQVFTNVISKQHSQ